MPRLMQRILFAAIVSILTSSWARAETCGFDYGDPQFRGAWREGDVIFPAAGSPRYQTMVRGRGGARPFFSGSAGIRTATAVLRAAAQAISSTDLTDCSENLRHFLRQSRPLEGTIDRQAYASHFFDAKLNLRSIGQLHHCRRDHTIEIDNWTPWPRYVTFPEGAYYWFIKLQLTADERKVESVRYVSMRAIDQNTMIPVHETKCEGR